jgi:hypothetical protein
MSKCLSMGEVAVLENLAQQGSFQGSGGSRDSQESWRSLADLETLQKET